MIAAFKWGRRWCTLGAGFALLCPILGGAQSRPADVAERISRVERSLRRGIVLEGEPAERFTVEERMRAHRAPGVSVAVMRDGKVEWAKGYGVRRA
jgi:CubicO group peptidase (beta-lactamase class C family)